MRLIHEDKITTTEDKSKSYYFGMPGLDSQAVVHAHFERTDNPSYCECSNCGATFSADIQANYCPHCGSRMDEEGHSEWIPFKVKTVHGIREFVGDIPQDGQKVLISNNPYVFADTFCNDEDGCYLDDYIGEIKDGMAWMPLPEPYTESVKNDLE